MRPFVLLLFVMTLAVDRGLRADERGARVYHEMQTSGRRSILLPKPKIVELSGELTVDPRLAIAVVPGGKDESCHAAAEQIRSYLEKLVGNRVFLATDLPTDAGAIVVGLVDSEPVRRAIGELAGDIRNEGYVIKIAQSHAAPKAFQAVLAGRDKAGMFYAVYTFLKLLAVKDRQLSLPVGCVQDWPSIRVRYVAVGYSWCQYVWEPCTWDLPEWKAFIDFAVEQKFNLIHLLHYLSPWLLPVGETVSGDDGLVEGLAIGDSGSNLRLLKPRVLWRWDGAKLAPVRWQSPFLEKPEMLREVVEYAHARGIKIGLYQASSIIPCAKRLPQFTQYWDRVLRTLIQEYRFDAFTFEDTEGASPESHLAECAACQERWGRGPLARTRQTAEIMALLHQIIRKYDPEAIVAGTLHYTLHGIFDLGPTSPKPYQERRQWLSDMKHYEENLRLFKQLAPPDLLFDYIIFGGRQRWPEVCDAWRRTFGIDRLPWGIDCYTTRTYWFPDAPTAGVYPIWVWNPLNGRYEVCIAETANLAWNAGAAMGTLEEDTAAAHVGLLGMGFPLAKAWRGLPYTYTRGTDIPELDTIRQIRACYQQRDLKSFNVGDLQRKLSQAVEGLKEAEGAARAAQSHLICGWDIQPGVRADLACFRLKERVSRFCLDYCETMRQLETLREEQFRQLPQPLTQRLHELENTARQICDAGSPIIRIWPGEKDHGHGCYLQFLDAARDLKADPSTGEWVGKIWPRKSPITIDGEIQSDEWAGVTPLSWMSVDMSGMNRLYLCRDAEHLYLGAEIVQTENSNCDYLYVFLDSDSKGGANPQPDDLYCYFKREGDFAARRGTGQDWQGAALHCDFRAKASRTGWVVEARMPLTESAIPTDRRFNLAIAQQQGAGQYSYIRQGGDYRKPSTWPRFECVAQ